MTFVVLVLSNSRERNRTNIFVWKITPPIKTVMPLLHLSLDACGLRHSLNFPQIWTNTESKGKNDPAGRVPGCGGVSLGHRIRHNGSLNEPSHVPVVY